MPTTALSSPQLHLLPGDSPAYQDALARYEILRPVLQGQRPLRQQRHLTGRPYKRLWRDLQRFRRDGLYGLLDRRTMQHRRGKTPIEAQMPVSIQQQMVRLALVHPFTTRELARIVQARSSCIQAACSSLSRGDALPHRDKFASQAGTTSTQ